MSKEELMRLVDAKSTIIEEALEQQLRIQAEVAQAYTEISIAIELERIKLKDASQETAHEPTLDIRPDLDIV